MYVLDQLPTCLATPMSQTVYRELKEFCSQMQQWNVTSRRMSSTSMSRHIDSCMTIIHSHVTQPKTTPDVLLCDDNSSSLSFLLIHTALLQTLIHPLSALSLRQFKLWFHGHSILWNWQFYIKIEILNPSLNNLVRQLTVNINKCLVLNFSDYINALIF